MQKHPRIRRNKGSNNIIQLFFIEEGARLLVADTETEYSRYKDTREKREVPKSTIIRISRLKEGQRRNDLGKEGMNRAKKD